MLNRVHDYIYRPEELEDLNWYEFIARYDVKYINKANEDDIMRFTSNEHPLCKVRGVVEQEAQGNATHELSEFSQCRGFRREHFGS